MYEVQKLTDIDLTELQIGEKLTIYRGSSAFLTGPGAAGYVGEATVTEIKKRSALIFLTGRALSTTYRLRFKDARICRIPNGEPTMLYVHARTGRPTVTAYFTENEYELVKALLVQEVATGSPRKQRLSRQALERMHYHERLVR